MKFHFTIFFLLLSLPPVLGQRGIIHADTSHLQVIIPWANADSVVFRMPEDSVFQLRFASEVDSIYLEDKKSTYISQPAPGEAGIARKFYLRVVDGERLDLLSLDESQFFIKRNEDIFGLQGDASEIQEVLRALSDSCAIGLKWAKLVKPQKRPLSFFVAHIGQCRYRLFPYRRFGLGVGGSFWLAPSFFKKDARPEAAHPKVRYRSNFAVRAFGEWPMNVGKNGQLYLVTELIFSRQHFGLYRDEGLERYTADVDFFRVEIPVQARQYFTMAHMHPFINAGINYVHHISLDVTEGRAQDEATGWSWNYFEGALFRRSQAGYALGGGLAIPLDYKHMLSLQGRFNKVYHFTDKGFYSTDYFTFSIEINL